MIMSINAQPKAAMKRLLIIAAKRIIICSGFKMIFWDDKAIKPTYCKRNCDLNVRMAALSGGQDWTICS